MMFHPTETQAICDLMLDLFRRGWELSFTMNKSDIRHVEMDLWENTDNFLGVLQTFHGTLLSCLESAIYWLKQENKWEN